MLLIRKHLFLRILYELRPASKLPSFFLVNEIAMYKNNSSEKLVTFLTLHLQLVLFFNLTIGPIGICLTHNHTKR